MRKPVEIARDIFDAFSECEPEGIREAIEYLNNQPMGDMVKHCLKVGNYWLEKKLQSS